MARSNKQALTPEERQERRAAQRERLEHATEELLSSEGWVRWLRARSVLRSYSLRNTILIAQQAHQRGFEPTYVAGFRAWLKLNRVVAKGQKGLRILAHTGRRYLIEPALDSMAELEAIVDDYVAKADRLGWIPMHGW